MASLADRLRERISREGPLSFRDFMEAALFDPEEGYYGRGAAIGEPGDFVTSPAVSPAFAAAIASEFRRETRDFEGAVDFVEAGAGDGRFLEAFARALAAQDPEFAARVRLTAVERSASARARLAARGLTAEAPLESAERLRAGSVRGWIFSNELFDALPVARVEGAERGLRELCVALDDGRFVWTPREAPPELESHLAASGVRLAAGQSAEISLGAAPLYRSLARALARGAVVSFDYGHRAGILYHPLARPRGTLAVHVRGRRGGDPLADPGAVDLTAHVNWDDLVRAGESEGLATRGVFRQGTYLARAGLFDFVATDEEKWRAYRLIDPEGMGDELSVLIQTRETA